jgi:hypothetical protein
MGSFGSPLPEQAVSAASIRKDTSPDCKVLLRSGLPTCDRDFFAPSGTFLAPAGRVVSRSGRGIARPLKSRSRQFGRASASRSGPHDAWIATKNEAAVAVQRERSENETDKVFGGLRLRAAALLDRTDRRKFRSCGRRILV